MRQNPTSELETIEIIKHAISLFERQTGAPPSIDELAKKLDIDSTKIKQAMQKFLQSQKTKASSAFRSSFLEILMTDQMDGDEVRVIDEAGGQLGVFSAKNAWRLARNQGLDLFLIQPDANPPLACIMDYGRYKFEQAKRTVTEKKRHHVSEVKVLKVPYQMNERDYELKLGTARKLLEGGDKINARILLRGQETEKSDVAVTLLKKLAEDLKDFAVLDREPHLVGKTVTMFLSPINMQTDKQTEGTT